MRFVAVLGPSFALLAACTPATPPSAVQPNAAAPTPTTSATQANEAPIVWISDDVPKAREQASKEGKLLFVDAWAPWCHTCLSMKHNVLDEPALRPYADRVVFAAIDTDRERNAPFLQEHEVGIWPSLFVIDPKTNRILAFWPGAASLREVRGLLEDALLAQDENRNPSDPRHALARARQELAKGNHSSAFEGFAQLIAQVPSDWPRRSEALTGAMWSLYRRHDWRTCTTFGQKHVDQVRGSAAPADFCYVLMHCAQKVDDDSLRAHALPKATRRLELLVDDPPPEASVDDRADAMAMLADARKAQNDEAGFRALHERRLRLMAEAASDAESPEAEATHDYARAKSFLALGRGQEAIRLLQERERQLPDAYEPSARLADVLFAMKRHEPALAAIDRALNNAYGPRRLRYLNTKAAILEKLGRTEEMVHTLRLSVEGHESLARGQADERRLQQARKRYEEALKAQGEDNP